MKSEKFAAAYKNSQFSILNSQLKCVPLQPKCDSMNFEELLDSRNGTAMRKEQMPFGMLFKKVKDNKYENVLTLRHELKDSLAAA